MNNNLIDTIKDYINDCNITQAIMINGKWGAGKTHFVKNDVRRMIEKIDLPNRLLNEMELAKSTTMSVINKDENLKYKVVYISLYGITSIEMLTQNMYSEMINVKGRKAIITTRNILRSIKPATSQLTSLSDTFDNIFNQMNEWLYDKREFVFILDDFERSCLHVNDLLGYINNLTENNKSKVIIVADESKISNYIRSNNKVFMDLVGTKYLDMNEKRLSDKDKIELKDFIRQLQTSTETIYSNDRTYRVLKEKTIAFTLEYVPDLKSVIPELLNQSLLNENEYINKCRIIEIILTSIERYQFTNLREINSAITLIKKTVEVICNKCDFKSIDKYYKDGYGENKDKELYIDLIEQIVSSILQKKISMFRQNNLSNEMETITPYEDFILHTDNFNFIKQFYEHGNIDEDMLVHEFLQSYKEKSENYYLPMEPTSLLRHYYTLEDDEITEMLNRLKLNIKRGQYSVAECIKILYGCEPLLMFWEQKDINDIRTQIMEHISKLDELESDEYYEAIRESEMTNYLTTNVVKEDIKNIIVAIDGKTDKLKMNDINRIIDNPNEKSVKNLITYFTDDYEVSKKRMKKFFSTINIEKFMQLLRTLSIEDLVGLSGILFMNSDIDKLFDDGNNYENIVVFLNKLSKDIKTNFNESGEISSPIMRKEHFIRIKNKLHKNLPSYNITGIIK